MIYIYIVNLSGFNENPDGNYELRLKGPRLELLGPYSIEGRIMVLPIQGSGTSNITISMQYYHVKSFTDGFIEL